MTTIPPFLNIANVGNSKIPDSQMMQVFNFFPWGFRLDYQVFSPCSWATSSSGVDTRRIPISSSSSSTASSWIGYRLKNITLFHKEMTLSRFKLHLGKDSVTIIIFLVALSTEENSNKSKNRNSNISWWQLSIQQWLKGLIIKLQILVSKVSL